MSQNHSLTPPLTDRLDITAISPLFVDRVGRPLRLFHLEFDERESYIMAAGVKMHSIGGSFEY